MSLVGDGHLGGYLQGGDPDTIYPEMWEWLVKHWHVQSVLDVGCGDAIAVRHFLRLECEVLGIDGMPIKHPNVVKHDYTKGPFVPDHDYDLAWSAEFVEHVEEAYVPNFLATFAKARFVCMTHGEIGQPGFHHVNNQDSAYWLGAMAAIGFEYDEQLTWQTKAQASHNPSLNNHYKRSGMAFRRR